MENFVVDSGFADDSRADILSTVTLVTLNDWTQSRCSASGVAFRAYNENGGGIKVRRRKAGGSLVKRFYGFIGRA